MNAGPKSDAVDDERLEIEARLAAAQSEGFAPNAQRWFEFLGFHEGEAFEMQTLGVPTGRGQFNKFAFASTHASALKLLSEADERFNAHGVYVVMNAVNPAAATRAPANRWHDAIKGSSTSDRDITARRAILVDCDAVRPTGTSATDPQVRETGRIATRIHAQIAGIVGASSLAYSHSGNGRGIYLALDAIPESDELAQLVRSLLATLDVLHSCKTATIDKSVSDAKRLVPAMGTVKRKGAPGIAEYPHRRTAVVAPKSVRRITLAELEGLVARLRDELTSEQCEALDKARGTKGTRQAAPRTTPPPTRSYAAPKDDGSAFRRANDVDVERVAEWLELFDSGELRCPGCGESSGVALVGDGLKCLHARCASAALGGFRTPVDLVVEVRHVSPADAVTLIAERFGIEGFPTRTRTRPPPRDDYEPDERAPLFDDNAPEPPLEDVPQPPKVWRTPAERARALGSCGQRLLTGFATLDENTRGGFPVGRVVAIAGAPGAGKTTLAIDLARRFALQGFAVAVLAADEDADGLLIRWGQQEGLVRDRLEGGDEEEKGYLAEAFEKLPNLLIVDADEEGATVEEVSKRLAAMRKPGQPSILIIDSIQTVRTLDSVDALTPRARIDGVMAVIKRCGKVDGHLVLATCELARGAYRSKVAADRIDDLAAFKESGGIEYGVGVAIVLRNVPDEEDLVDVTVPKNRLGRKKPFRIRLDSRHARFEEVAIDEGNNDVTEHAARRVQGARTQLAGDVTAIRRLLLERPGIEGIGRLRACVRASGLAIGNARIEAAVESLGAEIHNRPEKGKPRWYLVTSSVVVDRVAE